MRLMIFFLLALCVGFTSPGSGRKISISGTGQGTTYHIDYFALDSTVTKSDIDSLIHLIDQSLSLYMPGSLVNQFNEAHRGIRIDEHMRAVVSRAIEVFRITNGQFDITIYPITEAWGFAAKKPTSLPTARQLRKLTKCVGSNYISVRGDSLLKSKACVKLDPNGIAQGYTVDLIADLLEVNGILNYIVELGGELRVKGRKLPGDEPITIGLETPGESEWELTTTNQSLVLDSGAITTSGSYRKYIEARGKKKSHLLNPHTGRPVMNELISVSVVAHNAITADAYDNALMVMGLEKAISFVESHPEISARFVYRRNDGSIADTMTSGFKKFIRKKL
ncbi:MAG: FAD:protein FMN transferase [Chitinophagaceae bacterium]|nr:FAD:protein FMN transferase [Chitinophagaceae bacterium]